LRVKMSSADLLDYNPVHGYSGVMVDWQTKSTALGMPLSHWIVERTLNAQHLTKYSWVQQWCMANQTRILEFTTSGVNKNDHTLGVPMLRPRFRDGRVRLPYGNQTAVNASNKLIGELQRYPLGTTDQVMACWFAASTLEKIARFNPQPLPQMPRPSVVRMLPDGRNLSLVGAR